MIGYSSLRATHEFDPLARAMGIVFTAVEDKLRIEISDNIRQFIIAIVRESLELRRPEWEKMNLSIDDFDNSFISFMATLLADNILVDVNPSYLLNATQFSAPQLSMIGFLSLIHEKWCKIFPFCR